MVDASFVPLLLLGLLSILILAILIWRLGFGILMAFPFILVGLQITKSDLLNGISLFGRFALIFFLTFYAICSRKNRIRFSPVVFFLILIPVFMILNSGRSYIPSESLGTGVIYLLMIVGILLGGEKILCEEKGRKVFVFTLTMFAVIMACLQIPFLGQSQGRLEGIFENVVGFMTVGTMSVIILTWAMMNQKIFSIKFYFYGGFAALSLFLLVLTAGRTALAMAALGIFVVLARKVKRNMIIMLIIASILVPISLRVITLFPGFESVKGKLLSKESSGREYLFSMAWNEIRQKPLFGWGTDAAFAKGEIEAGNQYHNSYLMFAVDHGILFGLMVLILFLWLPIRGLLLMRRCQTEEMKNMVNLSSAFIAGYTFANFLGGGFYTITGMILTLTAISLQEGIRAEQKSLYVYNQLSEMYLSEHSDN